MSLFEELVEYTKEDEKIVKSFKSKISILKLANNVSSYSFSELY